MSFNRADYERLVLLARRLVKLNAGSFRGGKHEDIAEEVFKMTESVIGQQNPPLF